MGTIATIVGIFIVIIIAKFIYDTYLTDNTDRRFEDYRKSDPIGAAELEAPKTKEGFIELLNALSFEESLKHTKTIAETFPEFIEDYGKNMAIVISNHEKLLLTNKDENEEFFVGIEFDKFSKQYCLVSELKDKANNCYFKGENIPLGTMNDILLKKTDWINYNDGMLSNVIIEATIFEFGSYQKKDALNVRFDGFYFSPIDPNNNLREIIRFYNDKTLINYQTTKPLAQVPYSFQDYSKDTKIGSYQIKNNMLIGRMGNISTLTYRFTISYITEEGDLFTRLYGRNDVSFNFYPFEKKQENQLDLSLVSISEYEYILSDLILKEKFLDALLFIESYIDNCPSQVDRLEKIKEDIDEKYYNSEDYKNMIESDQDSDFP